jgi:hypothetical protein
MKAVPAAILPEPAESGSGILVPCSGVFSQRLGAKTTFVVEAPEVRQDSFKKEFRPRLDFERSSFHRLSEKDSGSRDEIQACHTSESIAKTSPNSNRLLLRLSVALGIVHHLRRRSATADSSCGEFARFNLNAHLLQARSKRVNLLLLRINLATCL